ncbi:MAG: type I DNA topoisomerase [Flavobacteriaceae bacterium]|nr:type I DNA topoisomerase [Flavobacteriaceae bacterium]MCY4253632.1 type I DNA topoisomerase [Flavobacteriaceae bacterium]
MSQTELVIVESPAKAKTIEKFLGKKFQVTSTVGHILELPKKELGVDVDNGFQPKFEVISDKKRVLRELKKKVKDSNAVWLATDNDREGEAIAWHLFEQLKLKEENSKRITFTEITQKALKQAIENPTNINKHIVDARNTRRVLDRLVGYKLSPLLWSKITGARSAGRVQSVALRLIVEKEKRIENFKPKELYKVEGYFKPLKGDYFKADLTNDFQNQEEVIKFFEKCKNIEFQVLKVESKPGYKTPPIPFTTSSLQQEAFRKLNFSVSRTMKVAQRLYEEGWITYMRTDSLNLSSAAIKNIESEITSRFGQTYVEKRIFKSKSKTAQLAHEAIRPSYMERNEYTPNDSNKKRLYKLIWNRTIASQMSRAKVDKTKIEIGNSKIKEFFRAEGEVITFDGFLKVYQTPEQLNQSSQPKLPQVTQNESLVKETFKARQRFSKPSARYTQASLVKQLDEMEIGRPSTFVDTVEKVLSREYVEIGKSKGTKQNVQLIELKNNQIVQSTEQEIVGNNTGKLIPTDTGRIVNDFLFEKFQDILDYDFTAQMEKKLDDIAHGNENWVDTLEKFYSQFEPKVQELASIRKKESGERVLGKDPTTGRGVKVRLAKYGPVAQLGEQTDEEKPILKPIPREIKLSAITLDQALYLLSLPEKIGTYQDKEIFLNYGKRGPFIRYDGKYHAIDHIEKMIPLSYDQDQAIELIKQKNKEQEPILNVEDKPVTKAIGRFGPYLKWNNLYINIPKKFDFDNLSEKEILELIEKRKEKIIHFWESEDIRVEKGRWGTFRIIKGRKQINLPKTTNAEDITLDQAQQLLK